MERDGEATMLRHYVEGAFQGKELEKCIEEHWLGPRMLLSMVKQEMRFMSDAGGLCIMQKRQLHEEQLVRHCGTDEGELLWGGCAAVVGRMSGGWRWLQCRDTALVRFVSEGGVCSGVLPAKWC